MARRCLAARTAALALCATLALGCGGRTGLLVGATDGPAPCVHPPVKASCADGRCDVPAGCFSMGSPAGEACRRVSETRHEVRITRRIELGRREVTQSDFESLTGYNPSFFAGCPTCPVERVTWHEAAAYTVALSLLRGLPPCYACTGSGGTQVCTVAPAWTTAGKTLQHCPGYRLPTEAEWEYAYRAGTTTAYYNGGITRCTDTDPGLSRIAWYDANSGSRTHPVGTREANAWGLYDIGGNVWEWVHDWSAQDLGSAPAKDPSGPASGMLRVIRGGSWKSVPGDMRAASRDQIPPTRQFETVGFRVARSRTGAL